MNKITALIAARMGSSRFPGKTLSKINGKPMLQILIERLLYSNHIDNVVVATTTSEKDNILERWCKNNNYHCFRGSEDDVLKRLLNASEYHGLETIVEILGDNPFVHSDLIDASIDYFLNSHHDYVATITNEYGRLEPQLKRFPIGIRVQTYSINTLRKCERLATKRTHREHATSYIIQNPNKFNLGFIEAGRNFSECNRPELTFAVNLEKNFLLIRNLYIECIKINPNFSINELLKVYDNNLDWHSLMGNE